MPPEPAGAPLGWVVAEGPEEAPGRCAEEDAAGAEYTGRGPVWGMITRRGVAGGVAVDAPASVGRPTVGSEIEGAGTASTLGAAISGTGALDATGSALVIAMGGALTLGAGAS